jgi:hypothetical protein
MILSHDLRGADRRFCHLSRGTKQRWDATVLQWDCKGVFAMSVVLDLPLELESELAAEATKLQLPLGEYILRLLAVRRLSHPKPSSGAELVAYWQSEGLVGTRPDIADAPGHARSLRQQAEKRERP